MFLKLVIINILILFNLRNCEGQEVTRIVTDRKYLVKLLKVEPEVVSSLKEYIKNEQERLNLIQKYIDSYENILELNIENIDDFLDHPLNTYQAIKHLSREWTEVNEIITFQQYLSEDLVANINSIRENYQHSKYDLYNAGTSVHRLQLTYNLSIADLAEGRIVSTDNNTNHDELKPSKVPLSAFDCLQISLGATDDGYISEAEKWADCAESKLKSGDNTTSDEFLEAQRKIIIEKKEDKESYEINEYYRSHEDLELSYYLYRQEQIDADVENEMFKRLCRNTTLRFAEWQSRLYCKYETRNSSFLLLRPLKLEVASEYPRIEVIHDFITDGQIDKVVHRAKQLESESSEVNDEVLGINGVDMTSRSSAHVWLSDSLGKDVSLITDVIKMATGLETSDVTYGGEPYQVANYATGGRYQPHPDHLGDEDRLHPSLSDHTNSSQVCGDRMATLMIYLNDVGKGGSTVFPDIGVSVTPHKGSAVFWWNVNKAGVGDDYTRHGGCPVLYGSKWIMNKWFCFRPQAFNKPCGLNEGDFF